MLTEPLQETPSGILRSGEEDSGGSAGALGSGLGNPPGEAAASGSVDRKDRSDSDDRAAKLRARLKAGRDRYNEKQRLAKLARSKGRSAEADAKLAAASAPRHAAAEQQPAPEVVLRPMPTIPADAAGAFLADTLGAAARVANGLAKRAGIGVSVPERYDSASPVLGPIAEHSPRATLAGVILAVGMTLGVAGYALIVLGRSRFVSHQLNSAPAGPAMQAQELPEIRQTAGGYSWIGGAS